jgi:hypothetical protein
MFLTLGDIGDLGKTSEYPEKILVSFTDDCSQKFRFEQLSAFVGIGSLLMLRFSQSLDFLLQINKINYFNIFNYKFLNLLHF